jgi:hypothetical protein
MIPDSSDPSAAFSKGSIPEAETPSAKQAGTEESKRLAYDHVPDLPPVDKPRRSIVTAKVVRRD